MRQSKTGGWLGHPPAHRCGCDYLASLALDFGFWIAATRLTSIANSLILANLAPIWVLLLAACRLRRYPSGRDLQIVTLSVVGAIIVTNVAIGMAAQGLRPVCEIQFAGFMYSTFDHLINHAARLRHRTRGRLSCPMVLRTPVGGGIRSIDNVRTLLHSGADKVAINTAAIARPELITEVSQRFGAQCMVLSVEAKRRPGGGWEAYTDNGREHTGLDVVEWVAQAVERGAGEVLLTAVDQEGTRKGLDIELLRAVNARVNVPVIISGGYAELADLARADAAGASGVAIADALHWDRSTLPAIKRQAHDQGLEVRL